MSTGHGHLGELEDDWLSWVAQNQENSDTGEKQRGRQGPDHAGHSLWVSVKDSGLYPGSSGKSFKIPKQVSVSYKHPPCLFISSQNLGQSWLKSMPDVLSPEKLPWASRRHFGLLSFTVCLPTTEPVML